MSCGLLYFSGSGKSTIISLIQRLYEVDEGEVGAAFFVLFDGL